MLGWRAFSRRGTLTSFRLCLVLLCVIPILHDVATCDECNAAPLQQPTLVDGEKVDPSKAMAHPLSLDHHLTIHMVLLGTSDDQEPVPGSDPLSPPRSYVIGFLMSRPPPFS